MGGILLRKDRLLWSPKSARSGATTGAGRDERAYSGQKAAGEVALIITYGVRHVWTRATESKRVVDGVRKWARKWARKWRWWKAMGDAQSMGVIWYDGMWDGMWDGVCDGVWVDGFDYVCACCAMVIWWLYLLYDVVYINWLYDCASCLLFGIIYTKVACRYFCRIFKMFAGCKYGLFGRLVGILFQIY